MSQPTPYLVQETLTNFAVRLCQQMGPFPFAGDIFVDADDLNAGVSSIGVFKADNPAGTSWTAQDVAGEPLYGFCGAFYPQAGGSLLCFAYSDPGTGALTLAQFDFGTLLFTVIATGGPVVQNSFLKIVIQPVRLSNGHFVIAYTDVPGATHTNVVEWSSGGGWGAPIFVGSGPGRTAPISCCVDTNDRAHFLRIDDIGSNQLVYFNYFGGVVSADLAIPLGFSIPTFSVDDLSNPGFYIAADDTVFFPIAAQDATSIASIIGTIQLTPSAAPAATIFTIPGLPTDLAPAADPCFISTADGSTRYALVNAVDGTGTVQEIWISKWTGSAWGTAAIWWDSTTSPPPISFLPECTGLSARLFADGSIHVVTGTFSNVVHACAVQLYMAAPPAPVIAWLPQLVGRVNAQP